MIDDQETFDEVWSWTRPHLQTRPADALLSWLWADRPDGSPGVLDDNAATDADVDAALALLFAARTWHEDRYLDQALALLRDIWDDETTPLAGIAGGRILVAGNWARGDGTTTSPPVINPSYFAPYAFRVFAAADPDRPWLSLVESSYDVLARIAQTPDLGGATGLVPEWAAIDPISGQPQPAQIMGAAANLSSYGACRLYLRLALDSLWFAEPRAQTALASSFPARTLQQTDHLFTSYHLDGTATGDFEAISIYAGIIPGLVAAGDTSLAQQVYQNQMVGQYRVDQSGGRWGDDPDDYSQNLAWFATAFMEHAIPNLWK